MSKPKRTAPFFGLQDRMPVVLALLLGFQHGEYIFLCYSLWRYFAGQSPLRARLLCDSLPDVFRKQPADSQLALAMLAGIITPPIIISGSANFDATTEQYLVSTSLSKFPIV
jgi:xanthine/uracil permease